MSVITEEDIYKAIIDRENDMDFVVRDFFERHDIMSAKHYCKNYGNSKGNHSDNCADHSIAIIYNKGKDNDQMLLTRIKQACVKKGYSITNANKWLGQLKRDGIIQI